jgi:hypothetical protein
LSDYYLMPNESLFSYIMMREKKRVWRYQTCSQNPEIEEGQTTQWPKEKGQKDKQRSIKSYAEIKKSLKISMFSLATFENLKLIEIVFKMTFNN